MPTTTTKGIPLPVVGDGNVNHTDILAVANWLDDVLSGKTTAQINALAGAAKWVGRWLVNTDTDELWFCDGTNWHAASPPVGSIEWLASGVTPDGYLPADGAAVSRTTYATLFSKIGTAFGAGDGSTTFNTPDVEGKLVFGFDAGQSEFNVVGKIGGVMTVTLTVSNMASHTHTGTAHQHAIDHDHAEFFIYASDHQHTIDQNERQFPAISSGVGQFIDNGSGVASSEFRSLTEPAGSHSHTVNPPNHTGNTGSGGAVETSATGGGQPFSILTPYMALRAYVKY